MNLPEMPLFTMLRERMSWLNQRQSLLSQNVANADTPGYVARDLKPLDFEKVLRSATQGSSTSLAVTDPRHIAIGASAPDSFGANTSADGEATPTDNSVSLEEEMIKVSDTQAQFQAATNLYSKAMGMMNIALDRGN